MQNAGRMIGAGTQCKAMGKGENFLSFFFVFFLCFFLLETTSPLIFFSAAVLDHLLAVLKLMSSLRQAPLLHGYGC